MNGDPNRLGKVLNPRETSTTKVSWFPQENYSPFPPPKFQRVTPTDAEEQQGF